MHFRPTTHQRDDVRQARTREHARALPCQAPSCRQKTFVVPLTQWMWVAPHVECTRRVIRRTVVADAGTLGDAHMHIDA